MPLFEFFCKILNDIFYQYSFTYSHPISDIVEYLVSIDCDINSRSNSGRTTLWKAACSGHREIVHFLFALGAQVNVQSQVGETVVFECVRKLHLLEILQDLIRLGASVNTRDIELNTALHSAAMSGTDDVL